MVFIPSLCEEIELLRTVKMDSYVKFNYSGAHQSKVWKISPKQPILSNESAWCNYSSPHISCSTDVPLALLSEVFFICGDQAWAAIPSHIKGGPCSLGRLLLLTPNTSMILQHKSPWRGKYNTHVFAPDCDDSINFWPLGTRWAVSFFTPQVVAAKALGLFNKLGCQLARQTNTTSLALAGLLTDVDSLRHATLQNRAAIDVLLLAHGHECEEFDGMCCTNLSDHSKSIHAHIKELQTGASKLREETKSNWLTVCLTIGKLRDGLKIYLKLDA